MRIAQKKRFGEDDIAALDKVSARAGRNRTFRIAITAFGVIDFVLAFLSYSAGHSPLSFAICGVAMILVGLFLVPAITNSSARKANSLLLGRSVKSVADDEGVTVESDLGKRHFSWKSCADTYELDHHIALRFGERSTVLFEKHGLKEDEIVWLLSKNLV